MPLPRFESAPRLVGDRLSRLGRLYDDRRDRRAILEAMLALTEDIVAAADVPSDRAPDPEAREALAAIGVDPTASVDHAAFLASKPVRRGLEETARLHAGALPIKEAALRLGVGASRLRQRVGEGMIVVVPNPHGRGWALPLAQFDDGGRLLPHLGRVLRAARRKVSGRVLAQLLVTPQEELDGATPRDWLAAGGAPEPVADLIASL